MLSVCNRNQFKARCKSKHSSLKNKLKHVESKHIPGLQEQRLLKAVNVNNVEKVESLLQEGVDPNSRDVQHRCALHIACSKGYVDIVDLLLKFGGDPNIRDGIWNTPMHLAACTSNLSIIKRLIDAGGDITLLDMHGKNSLQLAESKLHILMSNWKKGPMEMKTIHVQMQQVKTM